MLYSVLADIVVVLHFVFILFVVLGALLVLWRGRWAWVHVPAALWGVLIEFAGWYCPLTPLENWLRIQGGGAGYRGGFIEHYLLPVIYPTGLTRETQIILGSLALALNLAIYAWVISRRLRAGSRED